MQPNYLNELKSACKKQEDSKADQEKLDFGETIWIAGHPSKADEGTISLQVGINQTVIVREKDILEVNKDEDLYFVRIKVGTELLHKVEIVKQARPSLSDCKCDESGNEDSSPQSAFERKPISVIPKGCSVCDVKLQCITFTDKQGYVRRICIPIIRCENICI